MSVETRTKSSRKRTTSPYNAKLQYFLKAGQVKLIGFVRFARASHTVDIVDASVLNTATVYVRIYIRRLNDNDSD